MGWITDPSIGRRIRACISSIEALRGDTSVHRAVMKPAEFRTFLSETLGLACDDLEDSQTITERLSAHLHRACEAPSSIRNLNSLMVSAAGLSLARHMGVDPLRLAMCAFDARGRASDGAKVVDVEIRRALGRAARQGEPDRLSVRITLANGVVWLGRRMTARDSVIPAAMLTTLPGRTMRAITDHPWAGWEDITITSTERRGNSLIIDTDAVSEVDVFEAV